MVRVRHDRTQVFDVCMSPCPRLLDMPLAEVMTLSKSMSESVSENRKNLMSMSETASNMGSDTNSCPNSCSRPFISDRVIENSSW